MKAIAFLTMTFLPAAFISVEFSSFLCPRSDRLLTTRQSFFSTTFFSFGEEGLQASKQMWLYWVVTIPSTLLVVVFWRLLLHSKTPLTLDSVKTAVVSMLKRRRDEKKKKKKKETGEKPPV
jgi:hypothetical protein